jgi:mono/diheme cytochrome c family protein
MRVIYPLLLAVFFLPLSGCGSRNQRAVAAAGLPGHPAQGEQLYAVACVNCHGMDGKGSDLALHRGRRVNLTSAARWYKPTRFIAFVVQGVRGTTMPAFPNYTGQQLADINAYVRSLPK